MAHPTRLTLCMSKPPSTPWLLGMEAALWRGGLAPLSGLKAEPGGGEPPPRCRALVAVLKLLLPPLVSCSWDR